VLLLLPAGELLDVLVEGAGLLIALEASLEPAPKPLHLAVVKLRHVPLLDRFHLLIQQGHLLLDAQGGFLLVMLFQGLLPGKQCIAKRKCLPQHATIREHVSNTKRHESR
jgi:hypothetical protein